MSKQSISRYRNAKQLAETISVNNYFDYLDDCRLFIGSLCACAQAEANRWERENTSEAFYLSATNKRQEKRYDAWLKRLKKELEYMNPDLEIVYYGLYPEICYKNSRRTVCSLSGCWY